jgi:hypothetical protein
MFCLEIQQRIDNPEVMKFYLFAFRKGIDKCIELRMTLCQQRFSV